MKTKRNRKKFNINLYKKYAWLTWIYCTTYFNTPYKFYIFMFTDGSHKFGSTTVVKYKNIEKEDQFKDSFEIAIIRLNLKNHFLYEDEPIKALIQTVLDEFAHTFFVTDEQAKEGKLAKHGARVISYFVANEYKNCAKWIRKNWKKYEISTEGNLKSYSYENPELLKEEK